MRRLSVAGLIRRCLTGATLVRLVPISIVLAGGVALTTWTHRLLSEHRGLVVHAHEVIEMAKDILIGLDDAETGQQGCRLGGKRRVQLVAVLIGLASLLTRAGVEFCLARATGNDSAKSDTPVS